MRPASCRQPAPYSPHPHTSYVSRFRAYPLPVRPTNPTPPASRKFDVVVIDEAAQAVEPSTLVPLVMGCKQVGGGHRCRVERGQQPGCKGICKGCAIWQASLGRSACILSAVHVCPIRPRLPHPIPPVQVYLVGDPVQLPATVIATRAVEQGYDCSLFKRLQVGPPHRRRQAHCVGTWGRAKREAVAFVRGA